MRRISVGSRRNVGTPLMVQAAMVYEEDKSM